MVGTPMNTVVEVSTIDGTASAASKRPTTAAPPVEKVATSPVAFLIIR
jgi:hypothetical protein